MNKEKRGKGQFYTQNNNPFELLPFQRWLLDDVENGLNVDILEPFAGQNNIPKYLSESGLTNNFICYDIEPKPSKLKDVIVNYRNTITDFPTGYTLAITNPPFLSKSSASRHDLDYPDTKYNDVYKECLYLMLDNCDYVASIVPESFITSNEFTDRLNTYISLTNNYFTDTETPVGLALFNKNPSDDFTIFRNDIKLGTFNELKKYDIEKFDNSLLNIKIVFNDPKGKLGLHAIDSSSSNRIRFDYGTKISSDKIKHYSRLYSRITILQNDVKIDVDDNFIASCNNILDMYRKKTDDVFLTSFKNKNKLGLYRRRIDWETARNIIILAHTKNVTKNLMKNLIKSKYF